MVTVISVIHGAVRNELVGGSQTGSARVMAVVSTQTPKHSILRLIVADPIVVIAKPLLIEGRIIGVATVATVEPLLVVVSGKHVKAPRLRWQLPPPSQEEPGIVPANAGTAILVREGMDGMLSPAVEGVSGVVRSATQEMTGKHVRVATVVTIGRGKMEVQ